MKRKVLFLYSLLIFIGVFNTGCKKTERLLAGGFTEGNEKGLMLFELNTENGSLKLISETDAGANPSFFCFSKGRDLIYSLNEVMEFKGTAAGGLTTLKYDPVSGLIEKESEMPVPFGGPCHISLSDDGGFLFIASYASGSVAVVRIGIDGIPGEVSNTITFSAAAPVVSHPHMIAQDPSGKHVYLTDLGLDHVMIYNFDRNKGKLIPEPGGEVNVSQGSGPRHFVFNPAGTKMYLINELGSTIMVFDVDTEGGLKLLQTLPATDTGYNGKNACAEILIGKDGKFLYGSNRGENSIVVFSIGADGSLTLAGHSSCGGDWPRNFVIDPTGKFLLSGNQKSGDISVFRINAKTGIPEGPVFKAIMKAPAYLEFVN
jgi:3-carboxymuconate cyclase